ncbi:hemicentin-1-like isoform X1 [Phyllobates terribilis]|uniref:hemicentin-1-like isoform X1 n=1 Tax=Phyllobates terribilis TaxID=111132 RepID=UPI003CCB1649
MDNGQIPLCWMIFIFSQVHTGLATPTPTLSLNGTFGGSVDFDVFVDLPDEYRITWVLGETGNVTVIAEVNPGSVPEYHPQYRGRTQLFRNETLRLDNLTFADEGHYSLYVFNENTFITEIIAYDLKLYSFLNAPTLSIISDRIVDGTNVTIRCDAGNQIVTTYTFYRDKKSICSEPHVICRGSFLNFTPISETDSGSYTCTIQNPVSSNTSDSENVTVAVPVSAVTLTSNTSDLLLWPGRDSVSLRCSSNGTDVTYSWSLDGAALPQDPQYQLTLNNSILIISPTSAKDNGYFMCSARNWINSENSSRLYLNLASPVSAVTLTSNTSAVLWAGEDSVSLHCSAQGSAISFFWRLNGEPVSSNPLYFIIQSDSPPNSTLTISPVSRHDARPFTCTASNLVNSETSNALTLTLEPDLTVPSLSIISDRIVDGTNVTLRCDAGSQNVTSYTFYRDGQKIICSQSVICRGSFLDFTPISEANSGSYTCTIQNPGSSNTSDSLSLTVSVPVSAVTLTSNTSDLLLWPGRDLVSLRCSSNGTDVTYSWSLDGAALPQDPQYQPTLNNSILIISPISAKDNGYFMCKARNWIKSENSSKLYLNLALPVSAVTMTSNTSDLLLWPGRDSVSLRCSSNGTDVTYSWSLDGAELPQDPQYQLTLNNSILIISPIYAKDNGYFMCTAKNWINSENSSRLYLNLAFPVSAVTLTSNTSDLLLWPGRDSVSLMCSSNGTDVTYSWSLDGAALPQDPQYQLIRNNSMLIINPISDKDNGYFMCSARNSINSENSSKLYLNLASPVSAVTLTSNTSAVLWAGEDSVSLHCSAQGSAITFSWRLNGEPVSSTPPYYITQSDSPPNTTLTISPISRHDAGPLTCTASNLENSETSNILTLKMGSTLNAPSLSIISDRIVDGTNVTIQCDAGNQNVTSYTFYRDDEKIICSEHVNCRGSFLDFTPISENDSGSYTCTIQNPDSANTSDSLSLNVSVPVSAVTLTSNTSDLLLWPGRDSVSLRCSSNGTDVTYSWSLDGAALPQDPQYQLTLNNSILIISPISAKDNGYFMCTARNWINSENSSRQYLNLALHTGLAAPTRSVNGTFGGSVYFDVFVNLPDEYRIQWVLGATGNVTVIAEVNPGSVPEYHPQYRGRTQLFKNETLRLDNLTSADEGHYSLYVFNENTFITEIIAYDLKLYLPVSAVTLTSNTSNLLLWPGRDSVSLRCSSNGTDVTYSWSLDGAALPQDPQYQLTLNNSTLIISPTSAKDNGYFMCTARNWINSENSSRLYLNLALHTGLAAPTRSVNGTFGGSVYFDVFVDLPDEYRIQWVLGATGNVTVIAEVNPGSVPEYHPQYRGRTQLFKNETLRLDNLTSADEGHYSLYVFNENTFITEIITYDLKLYLPVSAVTLTSNTSNLLLWPGRDSVSLRCSSNGTDVTYYWSLDGAALPQDPQYQLTLNNSILIISPISAENNGYFMCTARNWINSENSSRLYLNLALHTGLAAPTRSVNGTFGGSVYFDVFVDLPDEYRIQWVLGATGNVTVIAEVNPGSVPEYHPQYRGRTQLFKNETLRLDNLTSADEGHYSLYVFNENTFITEIITYDLKLYLPVSAVTLTSNTSNLLLWPGRDSVSLRCSSNGTDVTYSWSLDGAALPQDPQYKLILNNSILIISPIYAKDNGYFMCTARNWMNSENSSRLYLNLALHTGLAAPTRSVNGTFGGSVYFDVFVDLPDEYRIQWVLGATGNVTVIAEVNPGSVPEYHPQYRGRTQLFQNETLRLDNLTSADEGHYSLYVFNDNTFITEIITYDLKLYLPVSAVTLTSNTSDLLLWPGRDSVALRCSSNGTDVTYSWSLDGAALPQDPQYKLTLNNSILIISPISAKDNGYFMCTARNWMNNENSSKLYLNLSLHTGLAAPTRSVNGTFGGSVYFDVFVDLPDEYRIQWVLGATGNVTVIAEVNPGSVPEYHPQYRGRTQLFPNETLRLDNLTSADEGHYSLYVFNENTFITEIITYDLKLYLPVSAVTLTSNTSDLLLWPGRDSVALRCSSNGTDVTYSWSLDGAALPQDPQYQPTLNNSTLIISPISAKDNGYFMCMARNWINSENSSKLYLNLALHTGLAAPTRSVNGTFGGSVYFDVFVDLPDEYRIQWVLGANGNVTVIAEVNPGSVPEYHPQYRGRTQLFQNETLRLDNLTSADEGHYSLYVFNENTFITEIIAYDLKLYLPVSAVILTSNTSNLLLWPGRDSVSLRCSSNGTDVTYSWSLDGAALPQDPQYQITLNNSILIISPISAKDNGYFMCMARNWINSENSSKLYLNLASHTGLAAPTRSVNGTFGGSVYFDVFADLPDEYRIQWVLGATGNVTVIAEVNPGSVPEYHPQYKGRTQLFQNETLRLDNLTSVDEGHYSLYVFNENTFITEIIAYDLKLYLPVSAVTLTSNTSNLLLWPGRDSVSLRCSSNGTDVTYSWSLDGAALPQDPQYKLTLNNSILIISPISAKDNGYFMCTARNWINSENSSRLYLNLALHTGLAAPTRSVYGTFGGSVYFDVFVDLPDEYRILWVLGETGNVTVIAEVNPGSVPEYHPQYRGRTQLFKNETLRLDNLTSADEGHYSLYVFNEKKFITEIIAYDLKLYSFLNAPTLSIISDRIVDGTNVTLWCDAGNQEATSYTFYCDDQKIICSEHVICRGSFLDFTPISENNSGFYTCTIQNPVSAKTSDSLSLTVVAPVSEVTLTSNTSAVLWAGEDSVSLHCSTQGSATTFSWRLNGEPVSLNPPYFIIQSDSPPNSTLTISPVSRHDAGPFTCTASNLENSETSNDLNLTLRWRPEGNVLCLATSDNDGYVVLDCSWPRGNPSANVTMKFNNILSTAWTTVTRNISRDHNLQRSNLTCFGDQMGKTSSCTVVLEPPHCPTHNNSAVIHIIEGEPVEMRVSLAPGLPAEFTWFHLNPDPVPVTVQSSRKITVESNSSTSSLFLTQASASESGLYECRARNIIGKASFNFNLRVTKQAFGWSGGAIAGIVVGALLLLIVIAILIFILVRRRARRAKSV